MGTGTMEKRTMSDGAEIAVYHVEAQGERRGGLVVVQEIFGVTDHIREVADGYAADGYEVLAPALFDREHPGFEVGYSPEEMGEAIRLAREAHPFPLSIADVQTCIDELAPKGPVFMVGYCYGGSVTWFAASQCTGLAAGSAFYGSLVPASGEEPKVPVVAHFGRFDQGIPMEGVEALIAKQLPNVEIHVYEAGHGFNSDRRKDYDEPSAVVARQRTLDLFRANGG